MDQPIAKHDATLRVPLRDGFVLATDVYVPRRHGRVPAVLVRTPYGRHDTDSMLPFIAGFLVDAGYAVVVQDVRGTGDSEGDGTPFIREIDDAFDTLEWLVQQAWCDGRVVCWGNSYYGFTAWAAVACCHPAVRGLIVRYSSWQPSSFARDGGVLRLGPMIEWLRDTWSPHISAGITADWSMRPLSRLVDRRHDAFLQGASPELAALRQQMAVAPGRVPTLHWVGWFDLFQRTQMREWQAVSGNAMQYLVATPTDHMDDVHAMCGQSADHYIDPCARDAMLQRTLDPVIDFMRVVLGNATSAHVPTVRWEMAGTRLPSGFQNTACWPPEGAQAWLLYPRSGTTVADGALTGDAGGRHGLVHWTHAPADLPPMLDGDWWRPLLRQVDYRDLPDRDDVLTFTGARLQDDVMLAGPVTLHLPMTSSAPACHVVVTLCDVHEDGTSRCVLQAAQRIEATTQSPVVVLGHTGYCLHRGHRLRLHIACAAFPMYMPHDGRGADPWLATSWESSRQTVDVRGMCLRLVVLPERW